MELERPDQPEQVDEFERELRQVMERKPAPPSLKRRIMQQRDARRTQKVRIQAVWWQRLAASLVLAGVIAGGYSWRQVEERRKGEEAKRQLLTALRITGRALNDMNRRLAEHDRADK